MLSAFDKVSKAILHASLAEGGLFHRETEVSPDAQRIDVWYVPDASRASLPPPEMLLDRMTRVPCTFEPFSTTPGEAEVIGCVRKQLNFLHILKKEGERAGAPPPRLPHQWLLSAGRPAAALRGLRAFARRGWPKGVYDIAPSLRTSIVVLRELPEQRSTLLVRLLGRGRTFRRAVAELRSLPEDAHERRIALPILVKFRLEVAAAPPSPDDEEFIMATQDILEVWERKIATSARLEGERMGRLEGERMGRLEGERRAVVKMLRMRFGELSPAVMARLESADAETLDRFTERVLKANTAEDVVFGD